MNNVLAVTLARGGSKGVPGKHLRKLGGKSVLAWTIDEVKRSGIKDYVVSSDDLKIVHLANKLGARGLIRPAHLALDSTPTLPALQHAVRVYEDAISRHEFDYIVEVRATSPFKTAEDIEAAVDLLIASGADSVIGVTPLDDHHPARAKWLDDNGMIHDFIPEPESGRRQDCTPKAYIRNGAIYALRREWVMGSNPMLFGHPMSLAYVMPPERSVNIDTEMDWKLCELIAQERAS